MGMGVAGIKRAGAEGITIGFSNGGTDVIVGATTAGITGACDTSLTGCPTKSETPKGRLILGITGRAPRRFGRLTKTINLENFRLYMPGENSILVNLK